MIFFYESVVVAESYDELSAYSAASLQILYSISQKVVVVNYLPQRAFLETFVASSSSLLSHQNVSVRRTGKNHVANSGPHRRRRRNRRPRRYRRRVEFEGVSKF